MSRFEDNRSERESFYVKGFNSNYLGYDDNDADENDADDNDADDNRADDNDTDDNGANC